MNNGDAINVQVQQGTCPIVSINVNFTVYSLPTVIADSIQLCDDGTGQATFDLTTLDNAVSGGAPNINVLWFANAGNIPVTPIAPATAYLTASTSVIAQVENTITNCTDTISIQLIVIPPLAINNPGNLLACDSVQLPVISGTFAGNQAYYAASNGQGTSYSAGDWISSSMTPIYIYDSTSTTPSCAVEESFNITINLSPNVTDVNFTLCEDVLGGASASGIDLTTYDASVNGGTPDLVVWYDNAWTPLATPANVTINDLDIFNVTVDNGNCMDSVIVDFSVTGTIVLVDPNDTLCEDVFGGASVAQVDLTTYESTVYSGVAPVYTWYQDAGLTIQVGNPTDTIVTNAMVVYVQVTDGNCSNATAVTFNVNSLPLATDANFQLCEDVLGGASASGIDLTVYDALINGSTTDTVVWYDNLWTAIATPTSATINDLDIFNVTVDNGICVDSAIVDFTVTGTIVLVDPNAELCEDVFGSASVAQVDLTAYEYAVYSGAAPVYNWYQDAGLTTPVGNPTDTIVTNAMVVYVQVTDGNCTNATAVTFAVNSLPVANSTTSSRCDAGAGQANFDLTSLNATVDGGLGNTVSWFSDPATVNPIPNPLDFTSASTTVYASVSDGACVDTASVYLIVNPLPVVSSTTTSLCDDGTGQAIFDLTSLNATVEGGLGNTVSWFYDPVTVSAIATPSAFASASTTVFASVSDGTCADTASVYLIVNPLPVANSATASLCDDGAGQAIFDLTLLDAMVNGGLGNTVSWFSDPSTIDTITSPSAFASASTAVYALVSDGICANSISVALTLNSLPVVDFSYTPNPVSLLNSEIEFNNESYSSVYIDSNYWNFDGLANSSEIDPVYTFPEDTGSYSVSLTVKDQNGCIDSTVSTIFIKGDFGIYVPGAFTPDDDGVNDLFYPQGFGIDAEDYSFYIFNRWGELLFETHSTIGSWDGKFKGENVQNGVYVWKVVFKDLDGVEKKYNGRVHLMR